MGEQLLPPYLFVTFMVGIACLSALVVVARRDRRSMARPFLVPYAALSVLVMASLVRSFLPDTGADPSGLEWTLQYLESFVGLYGVMFAFPFFVHRLFGVDRRRDLVILAITLVTALAQHLTEFGFDGRWDEPGDVVENVVFVGVFAYSLWVGFTRRRIMGGPEPLAAAVFVLILLAVPGIVYDLFFRPDNALGFYPLWYGVTSVVMTWRLTRAPAAGSLPATWGLSDREQTVVRLVQRGLSNKAIARELEISPNTVKTHLSSVFDKSGIRTRFGLMAALSPTDGTPGP